MGWGGNRGSARVAGWEEGVCGCDGAGGDELKDGAGVGLQVHGGGARAIVACL